MTEGRGYKNFVLSSIFTPREVWNRLRKIFLI